MRPEKPCFWRTYFNPTGGLGGYDVSKVYHFGISLDIGLTA